MDSSDAGTACAGSHQKRRNPLTASSLGGRVLSAAQLPWFLVRPPRDYGVLETVGRKTGKRRRCCVRVVRQGDQAGIVAIGGRGVGWLANVIETSEVRVRTRSGWHQARARVAADFPDQLRAAYRDSIGLFCYGEYLMWRPGRPSAEGIRDLHHTWLDTGVLVLLDLER